MVSHFSLCFLSYERPALIRRAVESAVATADEPVEVIVHDDGSTDLAVEHTLLNMRRQGLISLLQLNAPGNNEGQGVALNRMFHSATGEYVVKCDQDVLFQKLWLQRSRQIMEADRLIGMLGLFKYWHDPVDWRKTLMEQHEGYSLHGLICGSAFVMRRKDWLDRLGPFEERSAAFAEDHEMQTALAHWGMYCALPDDDLVVNDGFGVGRSTIALDEQGTVTAIKPGPYLVALGA